MEPWLPNCEGRDRNGLCLLMVPLLICSFFSIKHFILEIDNSGIPESLEITARKDLDNSRQEDFYSGKITLSRY